jgi:CubicO group peptidase (beta-lactamase class C family)
VKNVIRNLFLFIVIALISISPVFAQDSDTFPPDMLEAIQNQMDRNTANQSPPGMVAWVDAPGLHFEGASGYAHLNEDIPMTPDRAFKIGSITKLFTATVILQLMEEEVLTLDDALTFWLPEMAEGFTHGDQIRIRHLLNHTSGLDNFGLHPDLFTDVVAGLTIDLETQRATGECNNAPMADVLACYAFDQPALFEPGAPNRWEYSNTGYNLLGMIIEAATGNSLADEYRTRVLGPLDMTGTYLECYEEPTGDLVSGYTDLLGPVLEVSHIGEGSLNWAAAGMISTAPDLIIFARALFTGQLFDDPATLAIMVEPLPLFHYGFGVQITDDNWGHGGGTTGFASRLVYWPELDVVIVVLFNDESEPDSIEWTVTRYMRKYLTNQ